MVLLFCEASQDPRSASFMPNNLAAKETKKNASNSHAVFFASEGGFERLLAPHCRIIVNLVKLVDQVSVS